MTQTTHRLPLRSGGFLWGPRRVRLGLSLRELEEQSGVYRGFLSRMENGVMIPTADEFARVMLALDAAEPAAHPEVASSA
jgi:transcriptional regulator with XRE-family HTH domain